MSEQTFKSPGFFEREIDLTQTSEKITGIPAGIIGTANTGPAFVPVLIGNTTSLFENFGRLNNKQFGLIAAANYLEYGSAVMYVRVLGAGVNSTSEDISETEKYGTVKSAGFRLSGSLEYWTDGGGASARSNENRTVGNVQFISAKHTVNQNHADYGYPILKHNDSISNKKYPNIIRGMLFMASGARMEILDHNQFYPSAGKTPDDCAKIKAYSLNDTEQGTFKLVISSALGSNFSNDENHAGIKIYTASLSPNSIHYIGKILNTSRDQFDKEQHLLYADFPIDEGLAKVTYDASSETVGILSGTDGYSKTGKSSLSFRDMFGSFNTRYQSAKSTWFISQPFGTKEYDLFYFENLNDGENGNNVKVSITDLKRSTDKNNPYGTFTVQIRSFNDSDTNISVLEQFSLCTLNPNDQNYVANKIGDYKLYYNFDASIEDEKGLISKGTRPLKSKYVRIIMNQDVEKKLIPNSCLPFGFRGIPVIKTTDSLTDSINKLSLGANLTKGSDGNLRLYHTQGSNNTDFLNYSIFPPVPFTFKVTKGEITAEASDVKFSGYPGIKELADNRIYWGVQTTNLPVTSSESSSGTSNAVLSPNDGIMQEYSIIKSYSKFLGIQKLDTLLSGTGADDFCNNKFSLSKVALNNQSQDNVTISQAIITELTGTVAEHMREAAYIRNGSLSLPNYTISDTAGYDKRLTFSSLLNAKDPNVFNKFSDFMKFTNILFGGFDGVNILDKDQRLMNDKASSLDTGGKANGGSIAYQNLSSVSSPGIGNSNNIVYAYKKASEIILNGYISNANIITAPGIKEKLVTDHISQKTKEYSKAIYIMDIPSYDKDGNRLFDDYTSTVNVRKSIEKFQSRVYDNNYVATYFPDVIISVDNDIHISVPSSVSALRALAYNDSVAGPWFAPAGFNRGSLTNVVNTRCKLNTEDRNILYESNINPIGTFPQGGHVIFGQKTLQANKSALDRVNVRRMLLEVKRIVSDIAIKLVFEQNDQKTRDSFIKQVTPKLGSIQARQGIDKFKVVMDDTNNTASDVLNNKLNGKIILVPTRAIEYISMDFIITNSGVSFE